jgi:very-short-patch-repair endonuclease
MRGFPTSFSFSAFLLDQTRRYAPPMIRRREPYNTERARQLRADQTPPEGVFWSRVRGRRLGGLRFRRQHPIGPYIVDFACVEAMVVIEIDSSYHEGRQERDAERDAQLDDRGWRTVRVTASQLAKNEDGVLETVLRVCRERIEDRAEGKEEEP